MEQKIMGYIINPPFSTKDRIFKLELGLAISAAYKSEEKPTTTKITAKALNFIFGDKCIPITIFQIIAHPRCQLSKSNNQSVFIA